MTHLPPPLPDLPVTPDEFYRAGADLAVLDATDAPLQPALERLGPVPFAKSKFPFLGFLATVYEHVAAHCQNRTLPR